MGADLIARGFAAVIRAGAQPAIPRFADLSSHAVPAQFDSVLAGSGADWGRYAADSLATAALAAAHPQFCKADAAGRYFRLTPGSGGEIDFAHGGLRAGGGNMQPALQHTVSYAAATGIRRIVNHGNVSHIELWEPVRDMPDAAYSMNWFFRCRTLAIPACPHLEIDFGGAAIALKGPTGGARFPGQTSATASSVLGAPWLGGFINVTGAIDYLKIVNVDVDGGFTGDTLGQSDANLWDKGFAAADIACGTLEIENVTLHGFAAEIFYENAFSLIKARDCHFYNSGHSCWNPGGTGKVIAYNVQAGIARQPVEVIGGQGHVYYGGRFYGGSVGGTFMGGPDPSFQQGMPYNWVIRREDGPPPMIEFHDTRFESMGTINLGAFVRGKIVTVDTTIQISSVGALPARRTLRWKSRAGATAFKIWKGWA